MKHGDHLGLLDSFLRLHSTPSFTTVLEVRTNNRVPISSENNDASQAQMDFLGPDLAEDMIMARYEINHGTNLREEICSCRTIDSNLRH